jgi:uncharacterized protein (DUF1778 family)
MKDATIMIRVTTEQKVAIKKMARKEGMTITEFMLLNIMRTISKSELEVVSDLDFKKVKK